MKNGLYSGRGRSRIAELEEGELGTEEYRSAFRRDFARLLHSPSFRRLDGKTQLFPGSESDFFRNRLTHSLEVAQVAKSIAIRINDSAELTDKLPDNIDTNLIEFAALAHDLGHPPFGHNGEKALDECMASYGGFEGNAQTLRILSRLEKKEKDSQSDRLGVVGSGEDGRFGLNLTYRSLASVLKYDNKIPVDRQNWNGVKKGYYFTEEDLVRKVKEAIVGDPDAANFKTIECSIMDLADDIAYSTYDLEDAFKAGFLKPLDLLSADDETLGSVAERVEKAVRKEGKELEEAGFGETAQEYHDAIDGGYTTDYINTTLFDIFRDFVLSDDVSNDWESDLAEKSGSVSREPADDSQSSSSQDSGLDEWTEKLEDELLKTTTPEYRIRIAAAIYDASKEIARNSFERTKLTSRLVGDFIRSVGVCVNNRHPALSRVTMDVKKRERVEVLKHFTFVSQIQSARLQVVEYRGKDIVRQIFETLSSPNGERLLPDDFRLLHEKVAEELKNRVVCDFVAGMTDRYALDYYSRITSGDAQTIFKPY